ncbi:hypothetical protein [Holophaga foetida]|uniref:hypothetical protein n=1 Tax=Holophaga foetida TaxID=35839 RepID=UPI00024750C4|nr:hypothetical protein [Holophaga foetida]
MSWHETACDESTADQELRMELKDLLGLDPKMPVRAKAQLSPEVLDLAEELRREATRRQHASVVKTRRVWPMLLAAGLPVALALGGLGTWGTIQKRKADALAAAVQQKEMEVQRLAKASEDAAAQVKATQNELVLARSSPKGAQKARELVLPMQPSVSRTPLDTQTVSNPSR